MNSRPLRAAAYNGSAITSYLNFQLGTSITLDLITQRCQLRSIALSSSQLVYHVILLPGVLCALILELHRVTPAAFCLNQRDVETPEKFMTFQKPAQRLLSFRPREQKLAYNRLVTGWTSYLTSFTAPATTLLGVYRFFVP